MINAEILGVAFTYGRIRNLIKSHISSYYREYIESGKSVPKVYASTIISIIKYAKGI